MENNSAQAYEQQHWLHPKLGARRIVASSENASLWRKRSVWDPVLPQHGNLCVAFFWPIGREQTQRFGSQTFSRRHREKPSSVKVQCVHTQDKTRGHISSQGTHSSFAAVVGVRSTPGSSLQPGESHGTVPLQESQIPLS